MRNADNQRALKVIRTLRLRQDKYSKQIDVLCRDMVSAHQQFAVKLSKMNFVALFYEAILGCSDLEGLLDAAADSIRTHIDQANAAVFLLDDHGFDVHIAESGVADPIEKGHFHDWFTRDLVDNIARTNRVCSLEQMLRMGLQGPPSMLKTISAVAVPLGRLGQGVGFVLVYRPGHLPLQKDEMSRVAAISTGLRQAIDRFQTVAEQSSTADGGLSI